MFLSFALIAMAGCAKELNDSPPQQAEKEKSDCGSIYGIATLDESGQPSTRGVANGLKLWSKPIAGEHLTVKFLNGSQKYRDFVKETVKEWEKAGGIRFQFVEDGRDALIRVGFDYKPEMETSWSYTGTDNSKLFDKQTEPTIHFAKWRRSSDEKRKSDVLRAFGQALGLELEFQHPNFWPAWITDSDGNINEAKIREYWEKELGDVVTWEELKKMVLDPLSKHTFLIHKTDKYDDESVMVWPFYETIAYNIDPIEGDKDYNTTLSDLDKSFIESIYGPSFGGIPVKNRCYKVIEFDYDGTSLAFSLTTTKNLVVIWDEEAKEADTYYMPRDSTQHTPPISHKFTEAKPRKIIIAELLNYGDKEPDYSTALLDFSMYLGNTAKNVDIKQCNHALKRIFLEGGTWNFAPQSFNFTGFEALKELYLVQIQDSKVRVESCQALEIFSTSRNLYYPKNMAGTPSFTPKQNAMINPGDFIVDSLKVYIPKEWPEAAERYHSFSHDKETASLQIITCENIKAISLEHTRLIDFNLNKFDKLEYVYLSSMSDYLACGPYVDNSNGPPYFAYPLSYKGIYLDNTIANLPSRDKDIQGNIIVRNVITPDPKMHYFYYKFVPVNLYVARFNSIKANVQNKNWNLIWDSGYNLSYDNIKFENEETN